MKKSILILFCLLVMSSSDNAQYRINKTMYDYRTYSHQPGDPYSPVVAGVASFLIPGLGQMISGEFGRGAAFFGGAFGCVIIMGVGVLSLTLTVIDVMNTGDNAGANVGLGLIWTGLFGFILVDIWSVIDGVRVAKVNNLAFHDKNKLSYKLNIHPWINTSYYARTGSMPVGLSLKVKF
jgi:hypothetical protein